MTARHVAGWISPKALELAGDEAGQILIMVEPSEQLKMERVQAALFLSRSPVASRRLAELAELADGTEARTLVQRINEQYDRVGRAFQVKLIAKGYQMMTRPQFAPWLRQLENIRPSLRLSTPAMETLAVIAYRQPILKSEVEAIRGVSCGEMIRQLLERGLVKMAGRSEDLGRPFYYATTRLFLESFGLSSLDSMPEAGRLRGEGMPQPAVGDAQPPQSPASAETESTGEPSSTRVEDIETDHPTESGLG